MKHLKNISKGLLVIGCLSASAIASADRYTDIMPYLGLDFYYVKMTPRNGFQDIFPKEFPGLALYLGTKFHPNFAVEGGIFASPQRKRTVTLNAQAVTVKVRRCGGYLDFVASTPIVDCVELFGTLGIGWVDVKVRTVGDTFGTVAVGNSRDGAGFRAGIGLSAMATEMIGFRAKIGWEGASGLRFINVTPAAKVYGGATTFSLGAFVRF